MTDLELIFTMLGEKVTTGIKANKKVAHRGGTVAGNARRDTEKELGKSVISKKNYLQQSASNKKIRSKK